MVKRCKTHGELTWFAFWARFVQIPRKADGTTSFGLWRYLHTKHTKQSSQQGRPMKLVAYTSMQYLTASNTGPVARLTQQQDSTGDWIEFCFILVLVIMIFLSGDGYNHSIQIRHLSATQEQKVWQLIAWGEWSTRWR